MSDLPVPRGSWADLHAKREQKNNILLGAGIGVLGVSLFVVSYICS